MSSKLAKTIARQQDKIAEGQFYEAHQQLRVIAARYSKQSNWESAVNVLYEGSLALLKAQQGGSGGDLSLLLVETFIKGEIGVTTENKGKTLTVLRAFPAFEPTRKRFISEALAWTAKFGDYEHGDPEIHHVAGTIYSDESEVYDAERHFVLGTKDSPEALAHLEYDWYSQDDSHTAALYAARAVIPYLLTRNLRSANKTYTVFTSRLRRAHVALAVQPINAMSSDILVYPSLPLLNFLGLLLLSVQRGSADLYRSLGKQYESHITEVGTWANALAHIGEIYFSIKMPKQGNPLFDMMGSMLFGGGSGSGRQPQPFKVKARRVDKAPSPGKEPPVADLD